MLHDVTWTIHSDITDASESYKTEFLPENTPEQCTFRATDGATCLRVTTWNTLIRSDCLYFHACHTLIISVLYMNEYGFLTLTNITVVDLI